MEGKGCRAATWPWLAGFTDGDGCIHVVDPRRRPQHLTWTQAAANTLALEAVDAFLEEQRVVRFRRQHIVSTAGRMFPAAELIVARQDDAYDLLSHLLPHLVLKAEQAIVGIEVLDYVRHMTTRHGRRGWKRAMEVAA